MAYLENLPSIDVLIPTLNEEENLKKCLEMIVKQDYPKDKFKVTVIDGGSKDSTLDIARAYGCEVLINEEVLAEPGIHKGIENSYADLCCVLAVDNIIANERDFFIKMARPFIERNVAGAFPAVISSEDEPLINQYINYQAEPFSEFIYGRACNSRTFKDVYATKYENEDYALYDFRPGDFPLLALAQGFMIDRRKFKRNSQTKYNDIQPIINIIERQEDIAYVKSARIFHYQIMSLKSFIKKFQWRIKNNLQGSNSGGTRRRANYNIKQFLWIIYSVSLVIPLLYSLYQIIRNRKIFFIYHFITNTILLFLIPYTFIKLKLGKLPQTYKQN
jgi:glycosyltransferase involved in cell wall biosynthesis